MRTITDSVPKKVRHTYQRHVIMDALSEAGTHLSAYDIYNAVKKQIPQISFGTVYRNLNFLKEQGLVIELAIGRQASLWDGNTTPHYHFVCADCGEISDLFVDIDKGLEGRVAQQTGLKILGHRLELYGLCSGCNSKGRAN